MRRRCSAACTAWSCGRAKCSMDCERVMCWNVRGLNARAHGDVVQQLVSDEWPSVVCLQETKLSVISGFDVAGILGSGFDYCYLPAVFSWRGDLLPGRCPAAISAPSQCPSS
jgi:exonuclease III